MTSCLHKTGAGGAVAGSLVHGLRRGISVIEVLTSILIALIGLAGVLLMVPLAARQTQVGFDTEKAVNLARNAAADLEIRGFLPVEPPLVGTAALPVLLPNATSRCYCLDPDGVLSRMQAGSDSGSFPFLDAGAVTALATLATAQGIEGGGADQMVLVQRATIRDPLSTVAAPAPARRSLARGLFQWTDDLQMRSVTDAEIADPVFNPPGASWIPSKDLVLPIQQFDQSVTAGGVNLNGRRQYLGEMSWVALTVPSVFTARLNLAAVPPATGSNPGYPGYPEQASQNQLTGADDLQSEMRTFYLVYKKRPAPVDNGVPTDSQPFDRVYQVDWPGSDLGDPSFRYSYNGGTFKLRETGAAGTAQNPAIPNQIVASNGRSLQRPEIRRGDWIGLTNVQYSYSRARFIQQWNFYRVTDAALAADGLGAYWSVTLEGPEWDFLRPYSVDVSTSPPTVAVLPANTQPTFNFGVARVTGANPVYTYIPTSTLAVHLPDVWAVHERTSRMSGE